MHADLDTVDHVGGEEPGGFVIPRVKVDQRPPVGVTDDIGARQISTDRHDHVGG
jgi:hypothetical protein